MVRWEILGFLVLANLSVWWLTGLLVVVGGPWPMVVIFGAGILGLLALTIRATLALTKPRKG
jgi:threonine dehydrogenase-like Zn-dependent dehydrogenase